jgi:hypothetical protein
MISLGVSVAGMLLAQARSILAQFPATPEGRKVLESRFGEGVTITYKEVSIICERLLNGGSTDTSAEQPMRNQARCQIVRWARVSASRHSRLGAGSGLSHKQREYHNTAGREYLC